MLHRGKSLSEKPAEKVVYLKLWKTVSFVSYSEEKIADGK